VFNVASYGDSTQLLFLRARYYNPADGSFTSRDTWNGDDRHPLSFNRWGYVDENPVNLTDPTEHFSCASWIKTRADFAEKHVGRKNVDSLNTYTAAGIGVQCWGSDKPWFDEYQGVGIAQITDRQIEEAYGDKVFHLGKDGNPDRFDENGKTIVLGYGLRCWIRIEDGCTECKTRDELTDNLKAGQNFNDIYKIEGIHNQSKEDNWAVEYMRRRIKQVLDKCINCTETDKFIAAALSQNGPDLNMGDIGDLSNWDTITPNTNPYRPNEYDQINWELYFEDRIAKGYRGWFDSAHQLDLFYNVARELNRRSPTGWYIPSRMDINRIEKLKNMSRQ